MGDSGAAPTAHTEQTKGEEEQPLPHTLGCGLRAVKVDLS
jgi:hypothetical protein